MRLEGVLCVERAVWPWECLRDGLLSSYNPEPYISPKFSLPIFIRSAEGYSWSNRRRTKWCHVREVSARCFCSLALCVPPRQGTQFLSLRTALAVHNLTVAEARRGFPVELDSVVVLVALPEDEAYFMANDRGGIFVQAPPGRFCGGAGRGPVSGAGRAGRGILRRW